jgi:hypothetical protein
MKKSYAELKGIMRASSSTDAYYQMFAFCRAFVVTSGVKYFVEEAEAHWLIDVVGSYIPEIEKIGDYFFTVELDVDKEQENEGIFAIFHEISGKKTGVVKQNISYVDLPSGQYKFFLFHEEQRFIMICPSEY